MYLSEKEIAKCLQKIQIKEGYHKALKRPVAQLKQNENILATCHHNACNLSEVTRKQVMFIKNKRQDRRRSA